LVVASHERLTNNLQLESLQGPGSTSITIAKVVFRCQAFSKSCGLAARRQIPPIQGLLAAIYPATSPLLYGNILAR
jgi:hypothetical protein